MDNLNVAGEWNNPDSESGLRDQPETGALRRGAAVPAAARYCALVRFDYLISFERVYGARVFSEETQFKGSVRESRFGESSPLG